MWQFLKVDPNLFAKPNWILSTVLDFPECSSWITKKLTSMAPRVSVNIGRIAHPRQSVAPPSRVSHLRSLKKCNLQLPKAQKTKGKKETA